MSTIPEGYAAITPYLLVERVPELIAFLSRAFAATEVGRLTRPDGTLMHAEVEIGGSRLMLGEPMGEFRAMPGSIFLYADDVDATFARAREAGAEEVMPITEMWHAGERYGGVRDPSGNIWWVAERLETLGWEEQQARIADLAAQGPDA
jgi:uncharacterized glyoxalase superfamily protein PhnB